MIHSSIRPGTPWLDTSGSPIQAHGGSILFERGTFYWYGENKEKTFGRSPVWHWGVRCYSSQDLYNWEDLGLIIPPTPDDATSPLHPAQMVDRPHIIRNEATGKYVCWLKVMHTAQRQLSTVLTSDSLLGPYDIVATDVSPAGMYAGDFDLVVDPTDQKGYHYFGRPHSEVIVADLTQDYTGTTGIHSTHFPGQQPPLAREAPAYFRRGGKHYLVTSGTTGYFPNPSEVAVADTHHGPWTVLGDLHPTDSSRTSFRSQVSSVFKHPHKKDLYIALADRWLPDLEPEESNQEDTFRRLGTGVPFEEATATVPAGSLSPNTSIADYVWLPIRFDGHVPTIDWMDEWRIEDFD